MGPPDKSLEFFHAVVTISRTLFVMPFSHTPHFYVHVALRAVAKVKRMQQEHPQLLNFFFVSKCLEVGGNQDYTIIHISGQGEKRYLL